MAKGSIHYCAFHNCQTSEAFALVNHACELIGDRLIGWDVCIGPEGPIIIEGNHNYHMVMQEVAYGGYR